MGSVFKRAGRRQWHVKWRPDPDVPEYRTRRAYTDKRASEQLLAQLERDAAQRKTGLVDPLAQWRARPIADGVEAFCETVAAGEMPGRRRRGRPTAKYVTQLRGRLTRALAALEIRVTSDLGSDSLADRVRKYLRTFGSDRTRDHYVAALRAFGSWIRTEKRWDSNPFEYLSPIADETSTTWSKWSLDVDEIERLVEATAPVDPDRALVWLAVPFVGLRRNEAATLCWSDLDLDGDPPSLTVRAENAKNRREQSIPLPLWLADVLRHVRRDRGVRRGRPVAGSEAVFVVDLSTTRRGDVVDLLTGDAERAGIGRRVRISDPDQKAAWARWRMVGDRGERLCFHSFRLSLTNMLDAAGVPDGIGDQIERRRPGTVKAKSYRRGKLRTLFDLGVGRLPVPRRALQALLGDAVVASRVAPHMAPKAAPEPASTGKLRHDSGERRSEEAQA